MKRGDKFRLTPETWKNLSYTYREKCGITQDSVGTITKVIHSAKAIEVVWANGIDGGAWLIDSIILLCEKGHPYTKIFK